MDELPEARRWITAARAIFTTLGPNVPWTRASIDERVAAAVEDGYDTVMAFVQDEGYALWPSRHAPHAPRAQGRDLVAEWVAATHAAGLRFVAQWMGVHVQTVQMARHPGWLQRDATGAPTAAMCLNTAFGDALAGQVREVTEGYPVDGIYFDGLYARVGGCYCDACLPRFEARFGRPLARRTDGVTVGLRRGEHWLDFGASSGPEDPDLARLRFETVTACMARIASVVRAARPETAIVLDTLGLEAGFWPNGQDPAAVAPYVDAFALECYPDQVHEPLWHAAFEADLVAAESRRPTWMLRWAARDPDGDLVSVPPATIETQVATALVHAARPVIVELNLYSVDRSLGPVIARDMAAVERTDAWREGAEPVAWAAVLSSRGLRRAACAAGSARRAFDPLAGAWLALTEAHLPVGVVTDASLREGTLPPGTQVLVLPDVGDLDEGLWAAILGLVEEGLGLVATYRAGWPGQDGFLERIGVRSAGLGHRAGRIGTEALAGSELVNYLSLAADHPITAALAGRPLSYPGGYLRVSEAEGTVLGRIHDADFEAMDGERWFGWYMGAPTSILGVARELGRGRLVYWAAPLDSLFYRQGRPELGALVAASCRWAAHAAPALEVEAPVTVEVRAWRRADGLVVALANRTTNDLYAIGAGISVGAATSSGAGAGSTETTIRAQHPREVITLADVRVALPWEGEAEPRVETVSGGAAVVTREGSILRVTLPRLGPFEVIRVKGV